MKVERSSPCLHLSVQRDSRAVAVCLSSSRTDPPRIDSPRRTLAPGRRKEACARSRPERGPGGRPPRARVPIPGPARATASSWGSRAHRLRRPGPGAARSRPGWRCYPVAVDPARVRRWIAGFAAISAADREERRRRGADPAWSIGLALSMIRAARASRAPATTAPRREKQEEAVRATWARLRERLRR